MSNRCNKKVAIISVHGDPLVSPGSIESGGQNIYVYNLAKQLSKLGWQVDVFSRLDKRTKRCSIRVNQNLRVMRLQAGPQKFITKDEIFSFLPQFLNNLLSFALAQKEKYTVIHSNYWLSGWVGMQLKRILDIPLTHTFHSLGYIKYHTLRRFGQSNGESDFFRLRISVEKDIISIADRLITTNTYEKRDLIKYYEVPEHKLRVIPVGVDLAKFRPQDKKAARRKVGIGLRQKTVLYVGRLEWRKGIYTLIRAFKQVIDKEPHLAGRLQLLVVGGPKKPALFRDQSYKEVKQAVERFKIERNVVFTGGQPQKNIVNFYAASDIVVVPSYYEPFGIVPLEAMSMRVPVIASRTGGLQYSVRHKKTGILTPPYRENFLANRILEVLQNRKLYSSLQKNSRKRICKYFSWSKIGQDVNSFYLNIINNDKGK